MADGQHARQVVADGTADDDAVRRAAPSVAVVPGRCLAIGGRAHVSALQLVLAVAGDHRLTTRIVAGVVVADDDVGRRARQPVGQGWSGPAAANCAASVSPTMRSRWVDRGLEHLLATRRPSG